jgi:Fe-S cluster assembly protein SufD
VSTAYVEDFAQLATPKGPADWLLQLRQSALERFRVVGFPSVVEEDWRFNNLAPLTGAQFRLATAAGSRVRAEDLAPYRFGIPGASTLVFVNGQYAPALSTLRPMPAGVTVQNLGATLGGANELVRRHLGRYARPEQSGFTALNTAFIRDGLFVHVPAGLDAGAPIHAIFLTDSRSEAAASHPRTLILVERGARAAVLESFVGLNEGAYLTNAVTEAVVEAGGFLEHTRIQRDSELAFHVGTTHLHQEQDSRIMSYVVSLGGVFARHNLDLALAGSGIDTHLLGMYMGRGRQEVDNHTSILHAHPGCSTREVYKGILDGRSHGIFNGKIYVTPEAQKTDAKQTNRALLLSDTARIDTKPQLEIFADDVKCTHGATVGSLDPLAAFYLKSRGIGGALGRRILTYAFAAEVLEEIPHEAVRTALEAVAMARLGGLEGA